mgnify:CR=1 FL=1
MTVYSETFKTKMVQKMLSPNGRTMTGLSREFGVPEATLYRWRNGATLGGMSWSSSDNKTNATTASHDWSAEEKLAVVLEAAAVPDAELGEFLRRKGLHEAQLREWRQQALGGLRGKQAAKATTGEDARRVRELERELARKDKALAEAAALLIHKKTAQAIWGDEDDDTDPKSEK